MSFDPDQPSSPRALAPKKSVFDVKEWAVSTVVSDHVLRELPTAMRAGTIEAKDLRDTIAGGWMLTLRAQLLAKEAGTVVKTVSFTHEEWASWWQHTKAVHFPTISGWLHRPPRRTFKVATQKVSFTEWHVFPEYPEVLGPARRHVEFFTYGGN